jgi:N-hydroxyarylamine O-acetyltransferase
MIGEYLDLLGCGNCRKTDYENLCRLQRAHLEKIPYNNLEILYSNQVPSLAVEAMFEKMIRQKQGGYCFELNGLFAELLRSLGYVVREYFARWHFGGNDAVPMRRHRVIEVTVEGKVLIADVGIGSAGSVIPFELVFDKIQERRVRNYRFKKDNALGILLETETSEGWVPYYSFTADPHYPQDFEYVNFYCATSPDSVFRKKFFMHRQTEDIQYFIEDLQMESLPLNFCIRKSRDVIEKTVVRDRSHLAEILKNFFGVSLE